MTSASEQGPAPLRNPTARSTADMHQGVPIGFGGGQSLSRAGAFTGQRRHFTRQRYLNGPAHHLLEQRQWRPLGVEAVWKLPGPFTVSAQNDEAFAKVLEADLDALLKDWAKLTAVLTYRLVPGKVMAANVKAGKVKTVQGSEIMVSASGGLMIDSAKVTATDIAADSGVIQVIDSVIMPK
ncbi:MAG: fasciclin domain-containing protein [Burkholderiaceae bacterium]